MFKTGYKVVSLQYRNVPTSVIWCDSSYRVVSYPVGEWAYPHEGNGPLAVFDTLANAVKFFGIDADVDADHYAIYLCVYEVSCEEGLWSREAHGRIVRMAFKAPDGTAYASRVMILEKVEIPEPWYGPPK